MERLVADFFRVPCSLQVVRLIPRIVVDTNILVAASYAPNSAARRILEACLMGCLQAVASRDVYREYDLIVAKAVRVSGYRERLALWRHQLEVVAPRSVGRVVPGDPDDDKFVAAALGGAARWIVTNDRHLLDLDPYGAVRIVPSGVFVSTETFRRTEVNLGAS